MNPKGPDAETSGKGGLQAGHGGLDLLGAYPDFLRNLRDDFLHCEKAGQNR